jgi:hypothetical protein
MLVVAQSAWADSGTTYTATQTIPVPPQSTFPGSTGGGDGWAVALSNTQVFNVFHHSGALGVECHNQGDGSTCWPDDPTFITDGSGNAFLTSGQPGLYLDQAQGKLYVYAERANDGTGGVVCVDVSNPTADPTFCGFTALTAVGEASLGDYFSPISSPMKVGSKLYAFNYFPGAGVTGTENRLLCFDLSTDAACAGQPFTVNLGMAPGATMNTSWPSPTTVAINDKLFLPLVDNAGNQEIACWDPSTGTDCAGSWPITLGFGFAGSYGGPFAMLDSTGNITGLCLPTSSAQCYNLDGSSATTPANLPGALAGGSSVSWNGGGLVVGPRVYIPQWSNDVACFDYSTGASCAGFPKYFNNLDLLYTVNLDPQRPTCVWVNSDNGSQQIQDFDAFGGSGCGEGAIRVLASQFVVPSSKCVPASYQSLQITDPAASTYDTSGSPSGSSITFEDADGNPIPGVPTEYLDSTGSVGLAGLSLNGPLGLPQFLISLVNPTSPITSVTVKLTWTAAYDPSCVPPNGGVTPTATTTATSLSGGGQSGASISVSPSTAVTDSASLTGTDAAAATGTVTYNVYSDAGCTTLASGPDVESITTPGTMPGSAPVSLSTPGTYYWQAAYSGDSGNDSSMSPCGSEVETVTGGGAPEPVSVTTVLSGGGQSAQQIFVPSGSAVSDQATLSGPNTATAGGTLTYNVYTDSGCTVLAAPSETVPVTDGVVAASTSVTLPQGTYFWQDGYSGDAGNLAQLSTCGWETEVVLGSARFGADVGVSLFTYPSSTIGAGEDVICFTVSNYGPKSAKSVISGLKVPSGLTVVNSNGATQIGKLLIWKTGTLPVGDTITYHVWVAPSGSGSGSQMLGGGALSFGTLDPNYHNNFASESLTFSGARHMSFRSSRSRAGSGLMLARLRVLGRVLKARG